MRPGLPDSGRQHLILRMIEVFGPKRLKYSQSRTSFLLDHDHGSSKAASRCRVTSPIKSVALSTICEEATPKPTPPRLDHTIISFTPKPKSPGRQEVVQDVDYGPS